MTSEKSHLLTRRKKSRKPMDMPIDRYSNRVYVDGSICSYRPYMSNSAQETHLTTLRENGQKHRYRPCSYKKVSNDIPLRRNSNQVYGHRFHQVPSSQIPNCGQGETRPSPSEIAHRYSIVRLFQTAERWDFLFKTKHNGSIRHT